MKRLTSLVRYRVDRLALLLVIGIVGSAAWSIAAAEWMPRLDLLGVTVIAGVLLGALIVTRPWRALTAHLVMLGYGVVWVTLLALDQMPDKVFGMTALDTLRHLIVRLGEHVYIWGEAVLTGGVGTDNTIFLIFLSAIFWLISYLAVWNTCRQRRIWLVIAPAGTVLLINTYYYAGPQSIILLLGLFLFCVLLYAARMYTLSQEERWHFSRVRFNPEIKRDLLQIGSSIAIVAVVFGAVAPNVVGAPQITDLWREISRPVRSMEDSFSRLFSGLQPNGLAFANPFGRTLALLGQRTLGNELVMEVKASAGRYWQAVVYDEYTGRAFQSSDTTRLAVNANDQPLSAIFSQRQPVTQTFTVFFPNNTLIFAAPQPVQVDRAAWVESFPDSATTDFAMWSTVSPLSSGDSYQVVSDVSDASIEQLRSAGTLYPPAISARYLQLPASLPQRVRDLAQQIVTDANAQTPYDRASALEAWLRTHIKYNEKIPAPPPGQDGVDYVLFDAKAGYCDYYASAMAVMARSLGIPARIATGYTQGSLDPQRGVYQVFQFNAHTWTEVYFPGYGWVEFEPTASQPAIDRPVSAAAPSRTNENADVGLTENSGQSREPRDQEFDPFQGAANDFPAADAGAPISSSPDLTWLLVAGAAGLLLVGGAVIAMWSYENRGISRRAARGGQWAFARLARMAAWMRVKLSPAQTPFEQARSIGAVLAGNEGPVERVATLYVQERYGRTQADPVETQAVWRALRRPMWWAGVKRRLRLSRPTLPRRRRI